jgi:hypothetical protein
MSFIKTTPHSMTYGNIRLFAGTASMELAQEVAEILGTLLNSLTRTFLSSCMLPFGGKTVTSFRPHPPRSIAI